ncbi:MarR family transcriptional regulator [Pseudonocardia sp. WMMC193]|uniref:MarR family transcriptional regulator n=1 Tax=Pseudonocardia sp. WMMC193 TaxID=2911965 RepID=UPI001F1D1E3C|nr:MarR family transcriptional regulator [Pseudonocardia sp. WMMC193]MCF7549604.1 MarR family transcriptional regulator [Pseudonocardia sp. WMMC193]
MGYRRDELVRQPIGYWTGEAYRRIAAAIRESLAANALSQPQWWILNHLDGGPRPRDVLVETLTGYSDREEGRDVASELDAMVGAGLVVESEVGVALTGDGVTRLAAARERNGATHASLRADVSDEEYATTIDVLRRIVGNLGGDARLP